MKVLGIIAEYNPFHNGHLYHIHESLKKTSATHTVCIMSGNFTQRGEPAIMNKWARTKTALLAGIDLVVELPFIYAVSSAEFFASCAIRILDSMGIVDCISFGSESGNIGYLKKIAEFISDEPENYKYSLKKYLKTGLSFPAARQKAIKETLKLDVSDITGANNILAIEYLKALYRQKSRIIPYTIKRQGAKYTDTDIKTSFSSASSIRKYIFNGGNPFDSIITRNVPIYTQEVLNEEIRKGTSPVNIELFDKIILSRLRTMDLEEIKSLPYVNEGLENRLKEAAMHSVSVFELINKTESKRYPKTRINRILISLLGNVYAKDFEILNKYKMAQYIRILGFNSKGQALLHKLKKHACLPIISNLANQSKSCNPLYKKMIDIECTSTDNYVLAYPNSFYRKGGQEYTTQLIRI